MAAGAAVAAHRHRLDDGHRRDVFAALGLNPLHVLRLLHRAADHGVARASGADGRALRADRLRPLPLLRARVWNIGAEGQFIMGAIAGSLFPVFLTGWQSLLGPS